MNKSIATHHTRLIQQKYPKLLLTGSASLILLKLIPDRDIHDLDFVVSDESDIPEEAIERPSYSTNNRLIKFYELPYEGTHKISDSIFGPSTSLIEVHILYDKDAKEFKHGIPGMKLQEPAQSLYYKVVANRNMDLVDFQLSTWKK